MAAGNRRKLRHRHRRRRSLRDGSSERGRREFPGVIEVNESALSMNKGADGTFSLVETTLSAVLFSGLSLHPFVSDRDRRRRTRERTGRECRG